MEIFLSSWSVRDLLQSRQLNYLSLPGYARKHGFSGVELFDRFFESLDAGYLHKLRDALCAARCGVVVAISSDFTMDRSSDGGQRQFNHAKQFLNICRELGGGIARVSTGGQGISVQKIVEWLGSHPLPWQHNEIWQQRVATRVLSSSVAVQVMSRLKPSPHHDLGRSTSQKVERCISALRDLRSMLEDLELKLAIENHWGISTDPAMLVDIIRRCESERIGACPDFGNFHPTQDRYEGLELLAMFAKHVHAKCFSFNAAGEESSIDYQRCLRILDDAGYDGPLSVEYEGDGDAEVTIQQARELIKRHWPAA
jgi:sugar phosphate isomerase/epimerase